MIALPYPTEDLEVLDLADDPFWVACPFGHALCAKPPVYPDDIAVEDLLLLEDGHCLRDHVLAACELRGGRRNAAFQGTSLHTLVQMVANGLGVTLLPKMALDAGIANGLNLSTAPLQGTTASRRIAMVWRRTSARKQTFRVVATALRAAMG